MSDNILQPDPEALHQSAIDLLTHLSNVMEQGSTLLKEHNELLAENHSDYRLENEIKAVEQDLRYVTSDLEKVKSLELTLTIVAPMKAGKSTIINAIGGQDLLPSRNDAMTILPTEIVFSRGVTQPKLMFDEILLRHLREAWRQLHEKIRQIGLKETIDRVTIAFPRTELIEEIFSTVSAPLQSELAEPNSIKSALTKANDVFRLCNILDMPTDFLSSLLKIPRIEIPFPSQLSFPETVGTLVLVDTPGSNEAKSKNLINIVKDRLNVSAMILLVLDYTQLKTTAAEDVKNVIDEIASVKGRDRIYIVMNKIDERKNAGDLSPQQVLDLVRNEYQIEDSENRVFEISGRQALLATNFWRELAIFNSATPQEMTTADALGTEYYGKSWQNQRSIVTLPEMQQAAKVYWHDSGFDRFINTAIAPLVRESCTTNVIKIALKANGGRLSAFQSCLERQKRILDRDIQQIGSRINQLESDLIKISLANQRDRQQEIHSYCKKMSQEYIAKIKLIIERFDGSEFVNYFDYQLNIIWKKIVTLDITKKHYYFLVVSNNVYTNLSMVRAIVDFASIYYSKTTEIFNRLICEFESTAFKFLEEVNNYFKADELNINNGLQILNPLSTKRLDLDKHLRYFTYSHDLITQTFQTYKNDLDKYEVRLKKHESSKTIIEGVNIYMGCDLPNFISTGYTLYDPRYDFDPYHHNSTELIPNNLIEISSFKESPYKIRSTCIAQEYAFDSLRNLEGDINLALEKEPNSFFLCDKELFKDFETIFEDRYQLLKQHEEILQLTIQSQKTRLVNYVKLCNILIKILDLTANLKMNLKYQQKYSQNISSTNNHNNDT